MSDDARLDEIRRQIAQLNESMGRIAGDKKTPTFGEYALRCLLRKNNNPTLRISTKQSFEIQIRKHLGPAFGHLPLDQVTNDEFLRWVTNTRSGPSQLSVFFNARKALIEVLAAAKADGHLQKIPSLDNPDDPRSVGRALDPREVLKILRHTRDKMMRFFFFVLWKMGCRPREVLQWEWSMFTWKEPGHTWIEIPARISKTNRVRTIPVNPAVSRRLHRQFLGSARHRNFVFPSDDPARPRLIYQSQWKTACRRAGVDAVPYDLRRTFITKCAAEGKPLLYIAKHLDSSVKMLESVYAKNQVDVMEDIIK